MSHYLDFLRYVEPTPLPDELFTGYLGRFRALNQIPTIHSLFKTLQRQISPEGSKRRKTVTLAAGLAGVPVESFTRLHSLLPWLGAFRHFPPEQIAEDHDWLGRPEKRLRVCRDCIAEDLGFWGFTYWRRSHQIVGVTWCLKHGCGLTETRIKSACECAPDEALSHDSALGPLPLAASETQLRYAEIVTGLMEQPRPAGRRGIMSALRRRLRAGFPGQSFQQIDARLRAGAEPWVEREVVYGAHSEPYQPAMYITQDFSTSDAPTLTYIAARCFGTSHDALEAMLQPSMAYGMDAVT